MSFILVTLVLSFSLFATESNSGTSTENGALDQSKLPADRILEDGMNFGEELVRMITVLIGMIIVLLLAAKFLPRLLGNRVRLRSGNVIQVIESKQLEPRKNIYLVKVGEQYFLVGSQESGLSILSGEAIDSKSLEAVIGNAATDKDDGKTKPDPKIAFGDVLRKGGNPESG